MRDAITCPVNHEIAPVRVQLLLRDAAKAVPGLCHQTAYNINLILAQRGVIEIVRVGDARPNGKASKFRYLLSQGENGAEEDDGELEI
jgi:hypothetical protein